MSTINKLHYRYQVCPHCKSKRLEAVDMVSLNNEEATSGHLCLNCDRFHDYEEAKFKLDRAEIKRDIKKLQRILIG